MDSLLVALYKSTVTSSTFWLIVVNLIVGSFIPAMISLFLPRRKTIQFGIMIYRVVGAFLLQKRFPKISEGKWGRLVHFVQTTFVDLSFGIYLGSRADLSTEQIEVKIKEQIERKEKE